MVHRSFISAWLCALFALVAIVAVRAEEEAAAAAETLTPVEGAVAQILDDLPGDYEKGSYRGYYYTYHFSDEFDWPSAKEWCVEHGGDLASIENGGIQRLIQNLIRKSRFEDTLVWINGHYNPDCHAYEWWYEYALPKVFYQTDYEKYKYKFGYNNWARGEPSRNPCVGLSLDRHQFCKWEAEDCDHHYTWVCQWNECQKWNHDEHHCERQHGCWYNNANDQCQRRSEVPPV